MSLAVLQSSERLLERGRARVKVDEMLANRKSLEYCLGGRGQSLMLGLLATRPITLTYSSL